MEARPKEPGLSYTPIRSALENVVQHDPCKTELRECLTLTLKCDTPQIV